MLPQPDDPVLVVLVVPELSNMSSVVGMPVSVLATGCCVQVENGIDSVVGAEANHLIGPSFSRTLGF